MLKRFIALCLLFALMLTQFSRVFIYAGFELNQKYIASALCENRDKPQMHCNGKCYLAKKLKQAEEKEKKETESNQKKGFQDTFIVMEVERMNFPLYAFNKKQLREIPFELPKCISEILHPPPPAGHLSMA